jgi:hypothetical protein
MSDRICGEECHQQEEYEIDKEMYLRGFDRMREYASNPWGKSRHISYLKSIRIIRIMICIGENSSSATSFGFAYYRSTLSARGSVTG